MPNPALLLCDTDVLIQFFLANELRPLKELKRIFAVQPAVVVEVADIELRWNGRYRGRFAAEADKAIKSGLLEYLDPAAFQGYLSSAPIGSSWAQFQTIGAEYARHVQRGEAYTFAAALSLGMPAISNDFRAIETLRVQGLALPCPVLRCFDLIAFSYQAGVLDMGPCEGFRDSLFRSSEHIPKIFAKTSFEKGLASFRSRLTLVDPALGASFAPSSFDGVLPISR
jgi:hypothetical protein